MMRSSVVLPQPDGPSSATSSPVGNSRRHVVERREAAEALADAFDCDAHDVALLARSQRRIATLAIRRRS